MHAYWPYMHTGNLAEHEVEKQLGANVAGVLHVPQEDGVLGDALDPESGGLSSRGNHQLVIRHCELRARLPRGHVVQDCYTMHLTLESMTV